MIMSPRLRDMLRIVAPLTARGLGDTSKERARARRRIVANPLRERLPKLGALMDDPGGRLPRHCCRCYRQRPTPASADEPTLRKRFHLSLRALPPACGKDNHGVLSSR